MNVRPARWSLRECPLFAAYGMGAPPDLLSAPANRKAEQNGISGPEMSHTEPETVRIGRHLAG